jgi:Lrp/AsnC family transcriptional regulator for asnA, asnC and gidA
MTNHRKIIDRNDDSLYNGKDVNAKGLDEIDRQIIAALKEDGRMSFAEIARRLDVSAGMVRERYHRLVQEEILQVVAVTNPVRVGYDMMTLIGIKVDGSRLREIAQQIAAFEEVVYLVLSTGTFDLLAEVICRDNADLLHFLAKRLHAIEGIRDTQTFVYLDIVKEIYT